MYKVDPDDSAIARRGWRMQKRVKREKERIKKKAEEKGMEAFQLFATFPSLLKGDRLSPVAEREGGG